MPIGLGGILFSCQATQTNKGKKMTIFTKDLNHAVSYSNLSPLGRFVHNVRLTVSGWDGATRRFTGRDSRETNATNDSGQHIGNLFQIGTALVANDSGSLFGAVVARSASRAAAAMALRSARAGHIVSTWNVEKFNKAGESHTETFFYGADAPDGGTLDSRDDENGLSVITLTASEIALLSNIRIDNLDDDDAETRARMAR